MIELSTMTRSRARYALAACFLICTVTAAHAGEDMTYSEDQKAICQQIAEVLISHQVCGDRNDCHKRGIVFCSPAIKGVGVQLWGISNYSIIGPVLIVATDAFARRNGEMRLYVDVYRSTKQESLSRPFWPFDPMVAEIVFKGRE